MKCQYCNSEIPDNSSFCPNCGKKRDTSPAHESTGPVKKFCDNCGAKLEPGRSFCANCGKPVTKSNAAGGRGTTTGNIQPDFFYTAEAAQTPPAYSASSPAPRSSGKGGKTGLIVAIVLICVIALGGAGAAVKFLIIDRLNEIRTEEQSAANNEDAGEPDTPDADISDEIVPDEDIIDSGGLDTDDSGSFSAYNTLEEFIDSDILKDQIDSYNTELEGTGIRAEILAEGDTLVYNFVIENDAVAEVVDIDTVRASLEAESDVYEGIAAMLPAIADVENPAVVVRYVNSSGDELLSMTFTAD